MTERLNSQGAKLFRSTDGTTYTEVPQCSSIEPGGNQRPRLDATVLTDTAKIYRDALGDPNNASFVIMFDSLDTAHQAVVADEEAGTTRYWKIERPEFGVSTVMTYAFEGFLSGGSGAMAVDTLQSMSFEITKTTTTTITHTDTAES